MDLDLDSAHTFISSGGKVAAFVRTKFSSHCGIDTTKWPYDTHACRASIGSKVYFGKKMDLQISNNVPYNWKKYLVSPNWDVTDITPKRNVTAFGKENEGFFMTQIFYDFYFKRHSTSLTSTITVPAIVLAAIVLLTFWLPNESSERLLVLLVAFMSHLIYIQYLGTKIPFNTGRTILIVNLFRDSLVMNIWSLLVFIVNKMLLKSFQMPFWIQDSAKFIYNTKIPTLLLLSKEVPEDKSSREEDATLVTVVDPDKDRKVFFTNFIDRVHFLIFLITYLVMFLLMLP